MGMTAENLAEKYSISRTEQDEFALRSQKNAKIAISSGIFSQEIVPYQIKTKKGVTEFKVDEHPRETSLEKLAQLKPVFKENGTVTAGNSSGRNDGASALLLMSEEEAMRLGKKPKARVIAQAAAGVSPNIMGIGPVNSILKALQMSGLKLDDIDLTDIN